MVTQIQNAVAKNTEDKTLSVHNLFNANKAHITPAVSDSPKTFGRRKWELEVLFVTTTVTMEWLSECSTTIIIGL